MDSIKKELIQAQHRLDAIKARNRKNERNMRTRRLIQQGAILESVLPEVKNMQLDDIKQELQKRLR